MIHAMRTRLPDAERFYHHVTIDDKDVCWPWRGQTRDGYGRFETYNPPPGVPRFRSAHRVSYEMNVGPIPDGFTIDHVRARGCTMKSCVNPSHLEAVTSAENTKRGEHRPKINFGSVGHLNAIKTHCPKGHEYTPENIRRVPANPKSRYCRECHRMEHRRRRVAPTVEAGGG